MLAAAPAALAQAPVASFTVAPAEPFTGETVTLTATTRGTVLLQRWDLDNDGSFDDGAGAHVSTSFRLAGRYPVRLQAIGATGADAIQSQTITVHNRPPTASFTFLPAAPLPGHAVTFQSTAADPEGPLAHQVWDLDGDGGFDDAAGAVVAHAFPVPGVHRVSLQAVDGDGAAVYATQEVPVAEPPPVMLNPFPMVRLLGTATKTGARIRRLTVSAPAGATVEVRCGGRGCPGRPFRATETIGFRPGATTLRFRRLERRLRAGSTVKVLVTKPGHIGKYTRFRFRKGREPARRDLCLRQGLDRPVHCA